jgi:cell division protein FtsB
MAVQQSDSAVEQLPIKDQKKRLKRRRILAVVIILLSVGAFIMFTRYGLWTRYTLERKCSSLQDSIGSLISIQDSMRRRISILERDTFELERLAREQYGMIKPGEQVFIIRKKQEK